MASMGKYCKAYPVSRFREFDGWSENSQNLRKTKEQVDGKEVEVEKELTDTDILYLQENYTVTDGIFLDEAVVFDQVTPEWINFCKETLNFEIPAEAASNTSA
jgi:hypothetical protein